MLESCAALDVHQKHSLACARILKASGEPDELIGSSSPPWRATSSRCAIGCESSGSRRRDGGHRRVLEARLLRARGRLRAALCSTRRKSRTSPVAKPICKTREWGCQLIEHGLVRTSFVPPRPLRELRDLVRYRKAKIQERGREVQRVEKTLQDAGIKLSSVASEVLGKSARLMLDAMISGTHDPDVLAELSKGALRKKIPALREALQGRFTGHHALLVVADARADRLPGRDDRDPV